MPGGGSQGWALIARAATTSSVLGTSSPARLELAEHWQSHRSGIPCGGHGRIYRPVVCLTVIAVMADDIETVRKVGLQRAYALIRDLEAYRGFARLTPEQRALWEERAEVRAQAFCDGLATDLALMTASLDQPAS
jgi:hypothetical protein